MPSKIVSLVVNGAEREFIAKPGDSLLSALRDSLGLTAAKRGCAQGGCGTCTVRVDGTPVMSCLVAVETIDGSSVQTLEGIAPDGELDEVQSSFVENFATQCGFCTAGMIMVAEDLLEREPDPSEDQVAEAISGNVCRCTGYRAIVTAILDAAARRGVRV
jgi:carbon-monoxide dehydrogenase small subunit